MVARAENGHRGSQDFEHGPSKEQDRAGSSDHRLPRLGGQEQNGKFSRLGPKTAKFKEMGLGESVGHP